VPTLALAVKASVDTPENYRSDVVVEHMIYTTSHIQRLKQLLLLTMAIMLVSMGWYIYQYQKDGQGAKVTRPVAQPVQNDSDVFVANVSLTEMSNDRILWTLDAKEARIYAQRKETVLHGVSVDFYDQAGQKSTHLISDQGMKDDSTGNIIARGNVEATSFKEGIVLRTDELMYDAAKNMIVSNEHVEIEQGGLITSGDGLESDLSLSNARILKNVKTSFKTE